MKLRIVGVNDDLKEVAKLLINENVGFVYDGANSILSKSHVDNRGREFKSVLETHLSSVKVKELK